MNSELGLLTRLFLTWRIGVDEDEIIRASISTIFENFIGAFGSLNLGPQLLAKIGDR